MAMYDPEIVHKYTPFTTKFAKDAFNDIKDKLSWTDNETILDVGCGTGRVTAEIVTQFVPANSTIVAIDISEVMINFAKNLYNSSQITFKIQDVMADDLWSKWEMEHFSKVFSFLMMQRIYDDRKVYKNMFDFLKPGGEMFVLFPVSYISDEISPFLAEMPKYNEYKEELSKLKMHVAPREDHVSYTSEVLKSLGCEVIVCKLITLEHYISSVNDVVEIYGVATRLVDILPKNLLEEALEDSRKIISEHKLLEKTEGPGIVQFSAIIAIAKKPS